MRFGGHETFPVREGWLHKGLKLVVEEPEKLIGEHVADWLGVGRNMAKSIRYGFRRPACASKSREGGLERAPRCNLPPWAISSGSATPTSPT